MEKFGATSTPGARALGQPAAQGLPALGVEPGGAENGMEAVGDAELQVAHHHVGSLAGRRWLAVAQRCS